MRPDAQPERAVVAEHDLALGRLAEQAHVGDAAVRDEVARAGRVAAVLRALRVAVLRLLDLPATAAIITSPFRRTPASCSARTAST